MGSFMKSSNKTLLVLAALSLSVFLGTVWSLRTYDGWTHLELGAGNYGQDGHTQISQKKTVLRQIDATAKMNYIDTLPVKAELPYKPDVQFAILFETLDKLIENNGPKGVFHVNDLYEEYAQAASNALKAYAKDKQYSKVIIEVVPGDYAYINPEQSLKPYRVKRYDSVHLKNPEISFYTYKMDGDEFLSNEQSRDRARFLLQRLANYSSQGLTFFPIKHPNFIPEQEIKEFIEPHIFYQPTTLWQPVPYLYPDGQEIDKKHGAVYFISQNHG